MLMMRKQQRAAGKIILNLFAWFFPSCTQIQCHHGKIQFIFCPLNSRRSQHTSALWKSSWKAPGSLMSQQNSFRSAENLCKLLMKLSSRSKAKAMKTTNDLLSPRPRMSSELFTEKKSFGTFPTIYCFWKRRTLKAYCYDTHLITEDSDAARRRDLIVSEPNCSQFRREGQDEHLRDRNYGLAKKCDPKQIRMDTQHFHPSAEACP